MDRDWLAKEFEAALVADLCGAERNGRQRGFPIGGPHGVRGPEYDLTGI
jgi:hypothetical protein